MANITNFISTFQTAEIIFLYWKLKFENHNNFIQFDIKVWSMIFYQKWSSQCTAWPSKSQNRSTKNILPFFHYYRDNFLDSLGYTALLCDSCDFATLFWNCCTILALLIESKIMDEFLCSRCLNSHINLSDLIRLFSSGTTSSLVAKMELKTYLLL